MHVWIQLGAGRSEWYGMGYGRLDHNFEPKVNVDLWVCVCARVCVNKLVDNIEKKFINNKLLKTTSKNV